MLTNAFFSVTMGGAQPFTACLPFLSVKASEPMWLEVAELPFELDQCFFA
jgi:hypothetical protein